MKSDGYPKVKSQSLARRPKKISNPPTIQAEQSKQDDSSIREINKEQKAADVKMRQFEQGARKYNKNIGNILANDNHDWSSLYTHPKLMGQYYWKDDMIHTNKQRADEIRNIIGSNYGQVKMKQYIRMGREGK